MIKADMHIHSTMSDGILNPKEIISWAKRKNINAISITDHDTLAGLKEALEYIERDGMILIPGVELSCIYNGYEVHLLGYCFDYQSSKIKNVLDNIREARASRAVKMVNKLKDIGIDIDYKTMKAKYDPSTALGRPHIARELHSLGYVKDVDEAFKKYLLEGKKAFVPRYKLSLQDGIDLIHNDGGIAVLAHPGLLEIDYSILLNRFNIDGIEIYHPQNNKRVRNELLHIAKRKNMIITGGSDFHDVFIDDEPSLGNYTVDLEKRCKIENNICVEIYK
ncbi:PHP domain-containing protein [Clostridiaceae bacterium M8S5]|nr:PHP domain-containing protein [Clostridiaceae bacterium M8S5]